MSRDADDSRTVEHGADERIMPGTAHWLASYPDHIQRYRFALDFLQDGAVVLDAGCGVGYGAAELADNRAVQVVAVDISADALASARHHFDRQSITWCCDDCHILEHAARLGPYDVIINFENIEHLERPAAFVERAARLLGRDGILITSTPDRLLLNRLRGVAPDTPSTNPHHVHEMSELEFRALLERHFATVEMWYQWPRGRAALQLRLRALATRLGLRPVLAAGKRLLRRAARTAETGGATGATMGEWTISRRHPGPDLSWTLIAVCRRPRSA